ncbi:MAG TPA: isoprenylcysteine carboxylmethyltransferase family protein [Candidatus Kapabacteria bacterium]|nr:isoprenylcysteine carboxylmethyltransferase family protein [Candidatus Kapabacteria bacterium]
MAKITIQDLAGKGLLASGICAVIFFLSFMIEKKFDLNLLKNNKTLQFIIAAILLFFAGLIYALSLRALSPAKHNRVLVKSGPYRYVRHPRYAAIVFFMYPAAALIMHSMIALLSTVLAYLTFKIAIYEEERNLIKIFGLDYRLYRKKTPVLIPGFIALKHRLKRKKGK